MNIDFKLIPSKVRVPLKNEKYSFVEEAVLHLTYKDVAIARWQGKKEVHLYENVWQYLKTFGYLAEWNRRWKLKMFEPNTNWVQWDNSLRVDISVARREKPRMRKDSRGKWIVIPGDNWNLFLKAWTWAQQK